MADVKQCDLCDRTFDPANTSHAFHVERLDTFLAMADIPRFDVCSPRCLARLAARQDPAVHDPDTGRPEPTSVDEVTGALRSALVSIDLSHDPDADPDTAHRLHERAIDLVQDAIRMLSPDPG